MNFVTFKARVGDWLGVNETRLPSSVRGDVANMVRKELIEQLDLRFGEFTVTLPALAGNRVVALPVRFLNPLGMWTLDSFGAQAPVRFLLKEEFDLRYPDATKTADRPGNYTIWGNEIQLGKTPLANVSLNFNFYGVPADLSADGDEDQMMKDAWQAVLWGSLAFVSRYIIEDERLPIWDTNYLQAKADLGINHARARTSGRASQSVEPH